MKPIDFLKALGVAVATLVITLAASYPMVAFYAWFIETGHPQEFYVEAAQWIAPWSSHILGPLVFFAFNYFLAKRSPARNAMAFAVTGLVLYTSVDFSTIPMMGLDISVVLTASVACWLLVKLLGAIAGAYLGQRSTKPAAA